MAFQIPPRQKLVSLHQLIASFSIIGAKPEIELITSNSSVVSLGFLSPNTIDYWAIVRLRHGGPGSMELTNQHQ